MRRKFYIDPEVQFPITLTLIALVMGEGVFVGWGFSRAIAVARNWEHPDQVAQFFKILFTILLPLVAANFAIGIWLSHKIAGPLMRMRRTMSEIARGNLEADVSIRSGDFLHSYAQELNRMLETLRRLLYRDHAHAVEADALLSQARGWLAERKDIPDAARRELGGIIDGAKSRLSIINAHFMKGKLE